MRLNIEPKIGPLPVLYISGPMTGLPDDNFAAFDKVADFFRAFGFRVINPADFGHALDANVMAAVARDLGILHRADVLIMIDGWQKSKGAGIEYDFAVRYGRRAVALQDILRFLGEFFSAEDIVRAAKIYRARTLLPDSFIEMVDRADFVVQAVVSARTDEEDDEFEHARVKRSPKPGSGSVGLQVGQLQDLRLPADCSTN